MRTRNAGLRKREASARRSLAGSLCDVLGPQPSGGGIEPVGELQPSARGRLRAADLCEVESKDEQLRPADGCAIEPFGTPSPQPFFPLGEPRSR